MFPEIHLQSIQEIIVKEGYVKYQVSKVNINTKGDNYCAQLFEINIKGETENGSKETNLFVKILPSNLNNTFISIAEMYIKEAFFYKELSRLLTELQDDAKVPAKERFNVVKSYNSTNPKAIFLENLVKKGFKSLPRIEIMSLQFAELAVRQLAKFHGLFYVLQIKKEHYFNNNLKVLKQPFFFNKEWNDFVLNTYKSTSAAFTGELKKKVDEYVQKSLQKYPLYWKDTTSMGCTICHGDYCVGNILVKKTEEEFSNVVPVDYQMLHYGFPLKDLMWLLFSGSDQEFRKKHLTDLKNLYYDHIGQFLGYFNLNVTDVYTTRKAFDRLFADALEFGLIQLLYFTPFLFAKHDQPPNVDDLKKVDFILDDRYRNRIQGIVDDLGLFLN